MAAVMITPIKSFTEPPCPHRQGLLAVADPASKASRACDRQYQALVGFAGQHIWNNASVSNDLVQFPVGGANCSCDIGLSAHGLAIENVKNATRIGMIKLIDNPDHTGNKSISAAIRPVVAVQGLFEGCFRRVSHHHPPGPDGRQPSLSISILKSSGGRGDVVFVAGIAGHARRAGASAWTGVFAGPSPAGMIFADPAAIIAKGAADRHMSLNAS
jgi:hypothetical protein